MRLVAATSAVLLTATLFSQVTINGPMPGYSELSEVAIWMQCKGPCKARIGYWVPGRPDSVLYTAEQVSDPAKAHAMTFIADQVVPGTTYHYRPFIDGLAALAGDTLEFHTQQLWKYRTEPPDFTMALGSCTYINEPPYDRPGTPYGGEYQIFNSIADQRPDLMLWLGDNVYLREPDWGSWTGILHRYTHTRSTPELQRLLRATHHYAIWDDHDFGPNDGDASFVNAGLTTRAFDLFWPNPEGRAPGVGGLTTAFQYNDVDVFLLDDRSFRVPPDVRTGKPTMLGEVQIDWLIRALKYSDASFKLVALGSQFLNTAAVYETYATMPEERQGIIDRIHAEGIKGVVFLTGDRHYTMLSKWEPATGPAIHDLTVSPLTSSAHAPGKDEVNDLAVDGTLVVQRNYATLRFTGPRKERQMTISVRDAGGTLLWERTIKAP